MHIALCITHTTLLYKCGSTLPVQCGIGVSQLPFCRHITEDGPSN